MPRGLFRPSAAAVVALFFLAAVALATADSVTRASYVERVEPICQRATEANKGILRGVQEMVRKGELQRAAARFQRAANALEAVIGKLTVVPRPPADVERLRRWFHHARAGAHLLHRIGDLLREDKRSQAQRLANRLLREAKRANAAVVGFNFNYCRLDPARFA